MKKLPKKENCTLDCPAFKRPVRETSLLDHSRLCPDHLKELDEGFVARVNAPLMNPTPNKAIEEFIAEFKRNRSMSDVAFLESRLPSLILNILTEALPPEKIIERRKHKNDGWTDNELMDHGFNACRNQTLSAIKKQLGYE